MGTENRRKLPHLKSNLNQWDTEYVRNWKVIFHGCRKLSSMQVLGWGLKASRNSHWLILISPAHKEINFPLLKAERKFISHELKWQIDYWDWFVLLQWVQLQADRDRFRNNESVVICWAHNKNFRIMTTAPETWRKREWTDWGVGWWVSLSATDERERCEELLIWNFFLSLARLRLDLLTFQTGARPFRSSDGSSLARIHNQTSIISLDNVPSRRDATMRKHRRGEINYSSVSVEGRVGRSDYLRTHFTTIWYSSSLSAHNLFCSQATHQLLSQMKLNVSFLADLRLLPSLLEATAGKWRKKKIGKQKAKNLMLLEKEGKVLEGMFQEFLDEKPPR